MLDICAAKYLARLLLKYKDVSYCFLRGFSMKIVLLNAATLPVYKSELAKLLIDAVSHGASIGYNTRSLSQEEAENYFQSLRPAIAKGTLLLWIARDEIGVTGTIQLDLCQKSNGLNRAEVQKLLVHSRSQRTGIGHKLIIEMESIAIQLRRGLLYLDTQAGSPAESFYRAQGYFCMGAIPDYACSPDGEYHPTAIYFKRLFTVNQLHTTQAS
jgi:acetyltransferase